MPFSDPSLISGMSAADLHSVAHKKGTITVTLVPPNAGYVTTIWGRSGSPPASDTDRAADVDGRDVAGDIHRQTGRVPPVPETSVLRSPRHQPVGFREGIGTWDEE